MFSHASLRALSIAILCAVLLAQESSASLQKRHRVRSHSSLAKRVASPDPAPSWFSNSWSTSSQSNTLNGDTTGGGHFTSNKKSSDQPDGNSFFKSWSFGSPGGDDNSGLSQMFGQLYGGKKQGGSDAPQQTQPQEEQEQDKTATPINDNKHKTMQGEQPAGQQANSGSTAGQGADGAAAGDKGGSNDNGGSTGSNTSTSTSTSSHSHSHSSSSASHSSSYSFSSSSWYEVTSNQELHAPFQPYSKVTWTAGSQQSGAVSVDGFSIQRPAPAATCNQRFPYHGQADDSDNGKDQKYLEAYTGQLDAVHQMALDMHNKERQRYGFPKLAWNSELADFAACWADLKPYGHSERLFIANGENIGEGYGAGCYDKPEDAMASVINGFLDEDRSFAQSGSIGTDTGHYTQIMWKSTQTMGCALAARAGGFMGNGGTDSFYVTCTYYPGGNILSRVEIQRNLPQQVKPPAQLRSSCSANIVHTRK
ncbi:uncharacterized protein PFL1_01430 [Pseudozyma flocculosa PF-1]|uniref:SCP domain-containing protein n=1 Tax=Pseudozyma flocculosa TaxID=84751 RepID=A0A5C3EXZ1_9BASI|nr:uncharacterized protein PFL1_01430 [Pseudozyma flocculosa PF-1]EPQ31245.1 hypothetical protein PFL1_01430 [Pseudozyma flocculosa PF-1]SPO36257.1 uncharacterized protein PSFLO_01728 [Pseudozyma flocculosa]